MSVGKGSLKRVSLDKKSEILTLTQNNVVDLDVSSITSKRVTNNQKTVDSVKEFGVILPIIVEETESGLKVVDGARRLSALKTLGVKTVKAVVIKDGKAISAELKKFDKPEKKVEKVVVKEVSEKATDKKDKSIHEEKFDVIKRLGEEEMPVYLL